MSRHAATSSPVRFTPWVIGVAVLVVAAVLGAVAWGVVAVVGSSDDTSARAAAAAPAGVDSVIQEVAIASARLANFEQADTDRHQVILQRATDNLNRAANTLATDPLSGVPKEKVQAAEDLLLDLAERLDRLNQCLDSTATAVTDPDEAGASSTPDAGCTDPNVISDNNAAARTTGAAVLALREYGTMSEADVTAYQQKVAEAVTAEGAKGSTTDIPVPTK